MLATDSPVIRFFTLFIASNSDRLLNNFDFKASILHTDIFVIHCMKMYYMYICNPLYEKNGSNKVKTKELKVYEVASMCGSFFQLVLPY